MLLSLRISAGVYGPRICGAALPWLSITPSSKRSGPRAARRAATWSVVRLNAPCTATRGESWLHATLLLACARIGKDRFPLDQGRARGALGEHDLALGPRIGKCLSLMPTKVEKQPCVEGIRDQNADALAEEVWHTGCANGPC